MAGLPWLALAGGAGGDGQADGKKAGAGKPPCQWEQGPFWK